MMIKNFITDSEIKCLLVEKILNQATPHGNLKSLLQPMRTVKRDYELIIHINLSINHITHSDAHLLPRIDNLVNKIANSKSLICLI